LTTTVLDQGARPGAGGWAWRSVRLRWGLVALLVGLAGLAWLWTAGRMSGMDGGPWTSLGGLGWFMSLWVVMMAAMMFPSVAPTVALYARMTSRQAGPLAIVFAGGYLLTWAAAGLAAYGVARTGGAIAHGALAWDRAGRYVAAGTLVVAAVYELTPLKDACLGRCRSPLGMLLGSWRSGTRGALSMGMRNGAWCVGCCWALMASLFALGIMSLVWMGFVSALIAVEKLLPWRRVATFGTVAALLAIGVLLAVAPHALPGLTIPGGTMGMAGG
jgi:predicted metal-binding membrane protein